MTTKDFITKLNNADLVKKMSDAKSPKEAYDIAKANGLSDGYDAFVKEMEKLKADTGELSDDDLQAVAGGASTTEIVSAVSTTAGSAATAASAAA